MELWYDSDADKTTIDATTSGPIDIPSYLCNIPVVSIGEEAFYGCD